MRAPQVILSAILAASGALIVLAVPACQSPTPWVPPPPPLAFGAFSPEQAWAHLEALTQIGPRVTGTEGAERAREYILGQLKSYGIRSVTQTATFDTPPAEEGGDPGQIEIVNVGGEIPGKSREVIALVAPYDTKRFEDFTFVGANDGGSGAALLLELARVIAQSPLPYTTWVIFLDGESADVAPPHRLRTGFLGSTAAASHFRSEGDIGRIRLLVAFNRICDADLRIARDLRSHRLYREEFWKAAKDLGYDDVFPPEGFESVTMSQVPFIEQRLKRVVAITDTSFGGEEPPGLYANSEDDTLEHCSPESLKAVGEVTLGTLEVLEPRLAKLDAFSHAPYGSEEELTTLFEKDTPPEEEGEAASEETGEAASEETGEAASEETGEAGASADEAPADEVPEVAETPPSETETGSGEPAGAESAGDEEEAAAGAAATASDEVGEAAPESAPSGDLFEAAAARDASAPAAETPAPGSEESAETVPAGEGAEEPPSDATAEPPAPATP